jgi:general secretion pathway protein G
MKNSKPRDSAARHNRVRRILVTVVVAAALFSCRYEAMRRARDAALRDDLFEMRKAIDNYYADKKQYPTTLLDLVSEHYLRRIPADPLTFSASTWIEVPKGDGVIDVKSGAPGKASDGTSYRDW